MSYSKSLHFSLLLEVENYMSHEELIMLYILRVQLIIKTLLNLNVLNFENIFDFDKFHNNEESF
jgi:hypothetical protein